MSMGQPLSSEDSEVVNAGSWRKVHRTTAEIQTFHWGVAIWVNDHLVTGRIRLLVTSGLENHGMPVRYTLTLIWKLLKVGMDQDPV